MRTYAQTVSVKKGEGEFRNEVSSRVHGGRDVMRDDRCRKVGQQHTMLRANEGSFVIGIHITKDPRCLLNTISSFEYRK